MIMRLLSPIQLTILIFHLFPNLLADASVESENKYLSEFEIQLQPKTRYYKEEATHPVIITPINSYSKPQSSLKEVEQASRIILSDDNSSPPVSIYSFVNGLVQNFIYIVDFSCGGSEYENTCISNYLHEIKVPLIINNDIRLNVYQNLSFKSPIIRKRVFLQSFIFFLSSNFKDGYEAKREVTNYLYDSNTYTTSSSGSSSDTSFKQIFCFVTYQIVEDETIVQRFTKAELGYSRKPHRRHPIMFNKDKIPNEVYVGTISGQGMIPKLYYVCKHCEYERYQLHEITDISPTELRSKAQTVTMDGLNYIWVASYHDMGNLAAASPYLQDKSLRDMVQANDMKEEKLLLRMLLTKGNSTKYLNILNATYVDYGNLAYYPRIIVQLTSTPDTFMHPFEFDLDSYNFITCNGAIIFALNVGGYFNTFDGWVWLCISLTLGLGPVLGSLLLKKLHQIKFKTSYMLVADAMTFALISQYPRGNGSNLKPRSLKFMYRSAYGMMLIACIVIVNAYLGVVITNVTSPLPNLKQHKKIEQIQDALVLINAYDEEHKDWLENEIEKQKLKNITGKDMLSVPGTALLSNLGVDISNAVYSGDCRKYHQHLLQASNKINTSGMEPACQTLFDVVNQLVTVPHSLEEIGSMLSDESCSNKNFFLLLNSKIEDKITRLDQNSSVPFYKGKSEFFPHRKGWKVSKHGPSNGAMIKTLDTIIRSGIYNLIKELVHYREHRNTSRMKANNTRRKKAYKGHSLKYSAVTFYFYFICLGISAFILFCEKLLTRHKSQEVAL
jgi:hypothetical protein